jgi:hypothetical protein
MTKLADAQKENVFDFVPITFYVEMSTQSVKEGISSYNQSLQNFIQYF